MNHLLIANANHQLSLIDTETFAEVGVFTTPGRTAVLGVSASGRYGFAVHRDNNCVTIIDSATGSLLKTVQMEDEPTHFHAYDNHIVIFNDGTGSVSIFDERALYQLPQVVKTAQPDHGSAVVVDDYLLAGYLRLGHIDIYRIGQEESLQRVEGCPVLHGAAQIGSTALFGCNDGVLLLKKQKERFEAVKLPNPTNTPPRTRVGLFATHPKSTLALGNFGHGLVVIDPIAEQLRVLPLPAHPLKFGFDTTGERVVVLTTDGILHQLDLATGDVIALLPVVQAVEPPKGPDGKPRPTFAIGIDFIYITAPEENILVTIDLQTMTEKHSQVLPDKPLAVAYLHAEGNPS